MLRSKGDHQFVLFFPELIISKAGIGLRWSGLVISSLLWMQGAVTVRHRPEDIMECRKNVQQHTSLNLFEQLQTSLGDERSFAELNSYFNCVGRLTHTDAGRTFCFALNTWNNRIIIQLHGNCRYMLLTTAQWHFYYFQDVANVAGRYATGLRVFYSDLTQNRKL